MWKHKTKIIMNCDDYKKDIMRLIIQAKKEVSNSQQLYYEWFRIEMTGCSSIGFWVYGPDFPFGYVIANYDIGKVIALNMDMNVLSERSVKE